MPIKLNLLPPELMVSKSLGSTLKTIRALGIIAISLFVIMALGMTAFFVISRITLVNLNSKVEALKTNIKAQETSEQQVFLLKDRLAKLEILENNATAVVNLSSIEPFIARISPPSTLTQLVISPTAIDISANIQTNSVLTNFLDSLRSSKAFKSVVLSSISLNPIIGYSLELNIK